MKETAVFAVPALSLASVPVASDICAVVVDDMPVYDSKNSIGSIVNSKPHTTLVATVEVAGLISVMDRILLPG